MAFKSLVAVFIGGGLGSVGRFYISQLLIRLNWVPSPHWATFVINILASALLVIVSKEYGDRPLLVLLLGTGFCGGWSTFSTFSVETAQLITSGRSLEALLYVVLSVAIAVATAWSLMWTSFS